MNVKIEKLEFEESLLSELKTVGRLKKVKTGHRLFDQESKTIEVPFILSGLIKVFRVDRKTNEEILLYYLSEGETCAMSLSCCIEGEKKDIRLVAEQDSEVLLIPSDYLDRWLLKYPTFKRFIFASYQKRFDELLENIDSLVFSNLEERLWKYLLDTKQATKSFEIRKTHKAIADELGTSRVVISRLLKKLEHEGKIEQNRNKIEIM